MEIQHEAIDLRFWKGVGAFLLDRVLRGKDQERLFEQLRGAADRHLLLLHRLQQRRLQLSRRAIDFVGENDVGENRTFFYRKSSVRLIVDLGADDVGRKQIWRELDATERSVDRFSH